MALLASQVTLINQLIVDTTITSDEGVDLLSAQNGFSATQISFIQGLGLSAANESLLLETTRITQNQLEEELQEAKDALKSGNYNEARKQILLAEITLAGMSNYELGNRKIEYREGIRYIKSSIDEYQKTASTSAGKKNKVLMKHVRE